MADECFALFSGIVQTKGLTLKLVYEESLPQFVLGDASRLRQVLVNLIGNAIKFTNQGEVRIEISKGSQIPSIRFAVIDSGIGMSESTLEKLFQPYTQADSSFSRKYGGTGLGLAICYRLTELMGGTISAESKVGFGSTFSVAIPLPKDKAVIPASLQVPIESKLDDFDNKTVLLVEDNAVNRMVAGKMLQKIGVRVEMAVDGNEAVGKWKEGNFSLIFMDCQMPEMDGYEASRKIRALEKDTPLRKRIPIIALTAHAMEEDRQRCLDAGMDEYLTKPVKSDALRQAMKDWFV